MFAEFAEQASTFPHTHTHDATGDEAKDLWTFLIIPGDEVAAIQLKSLHFVTLKFGREKRSRAARSLMSTGQDEF